ncbi:hypothetical protein HanRHA438_Chr17g0829201 [Helianthus annuus]|nr:hypothetical protein HanRHA438_Chr17g0829201 [Helianthus annuus]
MFDFSISKLLICFSITFSLSFKFLFSNVKLFKLLNSLSFSAFNFSQLSCNIRICLSSACFPSSNFLTSNVKLSASFKSLSFSVLKLTHLKHTDSKLEDPFFTDSSTFGTCSFSILYVPAPKILTRSRGFSLSSM